MAGCSAKTNQSILKIIWMLTGKECSPHSILPADLRALMHSGRKLFEQDPPSSGDSGIPRLNPLLLFTAHISRQVTSPSQVLTAACFVGRLRAC